jgi:hypothetical protein
MNLEQVESVLRDIDTSRFPIQLSFTAWQVPGAIKVAAVLKGCKDRDTWTKDQAVVVSMFQVSATSTEAEVRDIAYANAAMVLEHELRECFLFRGERVYDPHVKREAGSQKERSRAWRESAPCMVVPTTIRQTSKRCWGCDRKREET